MLPTYACALGLWAVEKAGGLGAYDRNMSLHAAQILELHASMPRSGSFEARGRVAEVWDKGKAAIVTIVVECEIFTARYGIFLPGRGGWGGERGAVGFVSGMAARPGKAATRLIAAGRRFTD